MRFVFCFLFVLFAAGCLEKACASSMILNWRASVSSQVAGYNVYYGTTAGKYPYKVNVGNSTTITISSLTEGGVYYFVATAYDAKGKESAYSSPITVVVPRIAAVSSSPRVLVPAVAGKPVVAGTASQTVATTQSVVKTGTQTASAAIVQTSGIVSSPAVTQAFTVNLTIIQGANSKSPALIQFPVKSGHWYEVQATTNFRDWSSIWQSGITAANGSMQFVDPDSSSFAARFYRLVLH
jgi:hypothetical protein